MDNKKIGEFIYSRRKELGLTQQELADKIKITNKAVSKWENGDGLPEISSIPILATELKVSTDELLNGCLNTEQTKTKNTSAKTENTLAKLKLPDIKNIIISLVVCAYTLRNVSNAISASINNLVLFFTNKQYRPTGMITATFNLLDAVFWISIFIISICFLLKGLGYKTEVDKKWSIVALVLGIVLIFVTGSGYLQTDYVLFYLIFGLCAMLSVCHGNKLPYKIFFIISFIFMFIGIALNLYYAFFSELSRQTIYIVNIISQLVSKDLFAIVFLALYGVTVKNAWNE